jgi:hypothetical protein
MSFTWLTIHRVKFDVPRNAKLSGSPKGPQTSAAWRFGPNSPLGEDGFRTGSSDEWGGVGFYHSREEAAAVARDPGGHLAFIEDTAEDWHALACVIAHRGEADWSTPSEPHPVLQPIDSDPGGVMAVITSAGYVSVDETQFPRIKDFLKRVGDVIEFYGTLEDNTARCLFNAVEAREGMTFSVWSSDKGMMASAYKSGVHADNLKRHQVSPMFDRSSFTRLRLLESSGTWDGADPCAMAGG